ncbi:MAG TPA: GNAT family N-acetyltransferase [Marmoricola sp.]|nr:GNAT family N-acetyltransferase [Marmoricola sp.]
MSPPSAAAVTDPRVAAVEQNLLDQLEIFAGAPGMRSAGLAGVTAYHSDVAFPLFNAIGAAEFADEPDVTAQVARVVSHFVDRGLPFLWWPTPSTTSPALEQALLASGLVAEPITGMYAEPAGAVAAEAPTGTRLVVDPSAQQVAEAMVAAFAMPPAIVDALRGLVAALPAARTRNLLLLEGDRLLGCGTLFCTGDVAGLYNIATVEGARRRGIGRAMTRLLLRLGQEHGATRAVLHATPMGLPLYARLGFEAVCAMPQYLWVPAGL